MAEPEEQVTTPTTDGRSASDGRGYDAAAESPTTVLSAEQLATGTEWVESGTVRLRRRIVSETRTLEVVVRREELVIETHDVGPGGGVGESYRGTRMDGPAGSGTDPVAGGDAVSVVILLREEIPDVVLRPQLYERVTAELVTTQEMAVWHGSVRHEEAVLETRTDS